MPVDNQNVSEAVVLAAGQGTRLRPLTYRRPKPLIPILNKPFLQHQLELLELSGIRKVVLIIGHMKERIRNWLSDFPTEMELVNRVQSETRGTGDAINTARGSVDGDFVVMNGDILLDSESLSLMLGSETTSVAAKEVDNPQDFGVFRVHGDMVTGVVEKANNPPSNLANVGCYVFKTDIFDRIDETEPNPVRGEVEITDTLQSMVEEKIPIRCYPVREWNELGKPWDVLNLTEFCLKEMAVETNQKTSIRGHVDPRVIVGAETRIDRKSRLIGPSLIGPKCRIEEGSVIGPNCTVGEGSVLKGCVVKGSVIMDGCVIEPGSIIGHSVLASGVIVEEEVGLLYENLDGGNVMLEIKGEMTDSGRNRLGSIIGDFCRIRTGARLGPGNMLEPGTEWETTDKSF